MREGVYAGERRNSYTFADADLFGGFLHGSADFLILGGLGRIDGQVNNGPEWESTGTYRSGCCSDAKSE